MKNYYTNLEEAINDRIDYWRACGYSITISDDKKHIVFANNREKLPCYIDMEHGITICSGDYGYFIFGKEYDLDHPSNFDYMMQKYCSGEGSEVFDYDLFKYQLKKELEEIKESFDVSNSFCVSFLDAFEDYSGHYGDLNRATSKLHEEIEYYESQEDLQQYEKDIEAARYIDGDWLFDHYSLGMALNPRFVAQFAILNFAIEKYREKN